MADWYVSSVNYAAVAAWAATTAYTVGQLVRSVAVANPYSYYVHRCTTAGTSGATEPAWTAQNNGTTTSGTATFTNVSGQSAYGWAAAIGSIFSLSNAGWLRTAPGDRVFVASDHIEIVTASSSYTFYGFSTIGVIRLISVNRAGSVPPVAADVLPGATFNSSAQLIFDTYLMTMWQGFTVNLTVAVTIFMVSNGVKGLYFKDCTFVLSSSSAAGKIQNASLTRVVFDNTTVQFGHIGGNISNSGYPFELSWINTPTAIKGAIIPTALFATAGNGPLLLTCRGVDFSALTTALWARGFGGAAKLLLSSCQIAPGLARYSGADGDPAGELIELVNCHDGTTPVNERHMLAGALFTERTTVLTGGAQDEVGGFSHRLSTGARSDSYVDSLESFILDVDNTTLNVARTATVEITTATALTAADCHMLVEYPGTAATLLTSIADSRSNILSTTALTTSTATWASGLGNKYKLQVTFTPRVAGRIRARVYLGKPSTTIYVNPQLTLA